LSTKVTNPQGQSPTNVELGLHWIQFFLGTFFNHYFLDLSRPTIAIIPSTTPVTIARKQHIALKNRYFPALMKVWAVGLEVGLFVTLNQHSKIPVVSLPIIVVSIIEFKIIMVCSAKGQKLKLYGY
jgi:hypothetical protein